MRARRQRRPEDELQRAVVEWLTLRRPRCVWFHVPNGGARSRTEAAIMKGLGVRAGVPDLVFLSGRRSAGLELKTATGRQSGAQRRIEREFLEHGLFYAVARDLQEVEQLLHEWGFLGDHEGRPAAAHCGERGSCGASCRCEEASAC